MGDDSNKIHAFEKAGLGLAPFKFIRIEIKRYQACQGAPVQPGDACDYCSTGIMECCIIKSADGKEFTVGNECVKKTGDRGIIDPVKVKLNQLRREAKEIKDKAIIDEARQELTDDALRARLHALPHPYKFRADQGQTYLDYVSYMLQGAIGTAYHFRTVKAKIARAVLKIKDSPAVAP